MFMPLRTDRRVATSNQSVDKAEEDSSDLPPPDPLDWEDLIR